jgi:hypothetical protein
MSARVFVKASTEPNVIIWIAMVEEVGKRRVLYIRAGLALGEWQLGQRLLLFQVTTRIAKKYEIQSLLV